MNGPVHDEPRSGDPPAIAFDVPIGRVRDRRADRRGRVAIAIAAVVFASMVAGLALSSAGRQSHGPSPSGALEALNDTTRSPATRDGRPVPSPGAQALVRRLPTSRSYPGLAGRATRLPAIPSRTLSGAPLVAGWRADGGDVEILTWRSGERGMHQTATIAGAFDGLLLEPASGSLSPDGRLFLAHVYRAANPADDVLRVFRVSDGRLLWARQDLGPLVTTLWRPDSGGLVIAGTAGWAFLTIGRDGTVSERTISTPIGRTLGLRFSDRIIPAAFSADGQWLYGARGGTAQPEYQPVIRVAWSTGAIVPVTSYPAAGADGLDVDSALAMGIDPRTGRTLDSPLDGIAEQAPGWVAARNADGTLAFRTALATVVGATWTGDGSLVALETDRTPDPSWTQLVRVGSDGSIGATLLATGPVMYAGIVSATDGYVLVGFSAQSPLWIRLVLVRLADGATSTCTIEPADGRIEGISWIRP